jgi:hypothetical protein
MDKKRKISHHEEKLLTGPTINSLNFNGWIINDNWALLW